MHQTDNLSTGRGRVSLCVFVKNFTKAEFGLGVWRFSFIFFFWHAFVRLWLLFIHCSMNSSRKVWLFFFFSQSVHIVHCSWTHKFHFSTTFSLKMDPSVLFIHLKIILLQYFSVSVFSFYLYPNGPLMIYIFYFYLVQ